MSNYYNILKKLQKDYFKNFIKNNTILYKIKIPDAFNLNYHYMFSCY